MRGWSCSNGVSSVFTACLLSSSKVEKRQGLKFVEERGDLEGGDGVGLVVVCDVLDPLTYEAGHVIPEVASNFSLYFVLSLDAFVQVHSGLAVDLFVYLCLFWNKLLHTDQGDVLF